MFKLLKQTLDITAKIAQLQQNITALLHSITAKSTTWAVTSDPIFSKYVKVQANKNKKCTGKHNFHEWTSYE